MWEWIALPVIFALGVILVTFIIFAPQIVQVCKWMCRKIEEAKSTFEELKKD